MDRVREWVRTDHEVEDPTETPRCNRSFAAGTTHSVNRCVV